MYIPGTPHSWGPTVEKVGLQKYSKSLKHSNKIYDQEFNCETRLFTDQTLSSTEHYLRLPSVRPSVFYFWFIDAVVLIIRIWALGKKSDYKLKRR